MHLLDYTRHVNHLENFVSIRTLFNDNSSGYACIAWNITDRIVGKQEYGRKTICCLQMLPYFGDGGFDCLPETTYSG